MQNIQKNTPLANNHISVDCVVIGFDGEQLKVLLVKRAGEDNGEVYHDMKLPGSLIYMDEDLDEAAQRVLYELTERCSLVGTGNAVKGRAYCDYCIFVNG